MLPNTSLSFHSVSLTSQKNSTLAEIKKDSLADFNKDLHHRIALLQQKKINKKKDKSHKHLLPKIHNNTQSLHQREQYQTSSAKHSSQKYDQIEQKLAKLQFQKQVQKRYAQKMRRYQLYENSIPKLPPPPQIIIIPPYKQPFDQCQNCLNHKKNKFSHSRQQIFEIFRNSYIDQENSTKKIKYPRSLTPLRKRRQFSDEERKVLLRKFKTAAMAVYFTIIFPKYSKALLKRKYEEYKEINYESLFQDIKEKAIQKFADIDFINIVLYCEQQQKAEKKKISQLYVVQNDIQFSLSISLVVKFIQILLDQITKMIKEKEFEQFYTILSHLLPNSFPLSNVLVEKELENLCYSLKTGQLCIDKTQSEILMINFILIKLLIYNTLINKENEDNWLRKKYQEKRINKKILRLANQKIKISSIFLYNVINETFLRYFKKQNYDKLPAKLKVQHMEDLKYDYEIKTSEKSFQNSQISRKELIKNIQGVIELKQVINYFYIEYYDEISENLFKFSSNLRQKVTESNRQQLKMRKQKVLSEKFYNPVFEIDLRRLDMHKNHWPSLISHPRSSVVMRISSINIEESPPKQKKKNEKNKKQEKYNDDKKSRNKEKRKKK